MTTHFSDKLILARWALHQLGVADFDRLAQLLRAPEFEGWADDGGSLFVQQLVARLPRQGRSVSDAMLRDYDENIVAHWKAITTQRNLQGPTLYPLYFQYLGLLLTELYLDWYFRDPASLQASLNTFLTTNGAAAPVAPAQTGGGRGKGRQKATNDDRREL
ncbi:MAG: hypothetical protein ACOYNY_19350, partial [Caldilineaceae bacterium]